MVELCVWDNVGPFLIALAGPNKVPFIELLLSLHYHFFANHSLKVYNKTE